jgi:hypothetical protein
MSMHRRVRECETHFAMVEIGSSQRLSIREYYMAPRRPPSKSYEDGVIFS